MPSRDEGEASMSPKVEFKLICLDEDCAHDSDYCYEEISVGEIVPEEIVPLEAIPVVLHQGKYRLYQKPDGGLRLQYKRDDKSEDDFIELPGVLVKLLNKAQEDDMSPMDFMRAMMSLKRNHGQ